MIGKHILGADVQLIDLTHTLDASVPTWMGDSGFHAEVVMDYPEACRILRYESYAGIGTHMDAPSHFIPEGGDIASLSLAELSAPACVLDVSERAHPDYLVSVSDVEGFEQEHGPIAEGSVVFAYTGWSERWHDVGSYRNPDDAQKMHFPGFAPEAVKELLSRGIVGIGIDTLSPDAGNTEFPVHHLILGAGKYIVENLANLDLMPPAGGFVMVLPPKIGGGTEAPVRVVGLISTTKAVRK